MGTDTAAWIIEGMNKEHCLIGVWMTPGMGLDHSSFHRKLWGIYGILLMLKYLHLKIGKLAFN